MTNFIKLLLCLIGCVSLCSCELAELDPSFYHLFYNKCQEESHYDEKAGNYRNLIVYGVGLHVDTLAECTLTMGDHVSKEYTVHGFPLSCFSCYLDDTPSLHEVVEQLQDTVDLSSVYEMTESMSEGKDGLYFDGRDHRIRCIAKWHEMETEDLAHNLKFIFYTGVSVANPNYLYPTYDGISALLSKIIDQNANDTIEVGGHMDGPYLMVRGENTKDLYPWEPSKE